MSQYTMIQCPTCGGLGIVHQSDDEHERDRIIQNALRAMESVATDLDLASSDSGSRVARAWKTLRDALAELKRAGVMNGR